MADFEPITTQEEFDKRIKERIERVDNKWRDKYKDWQSPEDVANTSKSLNEKIDKLTKDLDEANSKISTHSGELEERDKKIKKFETDALKQKVAINEGLGWEAFDFLRGETEEEISESAKKMKKLGIGSEPMRSHERQGDNPIHEDDKNLVNGLFRKN